MTLSTFICRYRHLTSTPLFPDRWMCVYIHVSPRSWHKQNEEYTYLTTFSLKSYCGESQFISLLCVPIFHCWLRVCVCVCMWFCDRDGYCYTNVRRWTRKQNIFSKDLVLVPIFKDSHWTLMFVDMREKIIAYCDSLSGSGHRYYVVCSLSRPPPPFFLSLTLVPHEHTHTPRYVKGMFKYLQDEMWDKKKERMDTVKWQLKSRLQVCVCVCCVCNVYTTA